jgi:uncharacterized RDD family membrane protein YckC
VQPDPIAASDQSFPPATVGRRVSATLLDFVPAIVLFFVLAKAIGTWQTSGGQVRFELKNGDFLVYVALILVYYFVFELLYGRTPGKMALGLAVVDVNGGKPGVGQLVGRTLMRIIDFLPTLYLVAFITTLATDRNARLGDLVAKTAVVQR